MSGEENSILFPVALLFDLRFGRKQSGGGEYLARAVRSKGSMPAESEALGEQAGKVAALARRLLYSRTFVYPP
ncbi:hypothetical protein KM043_000440 [Ampulex compressa]|nr:hypothetical protein KM043_000440 [Ampulex compressa]